MKKGFLLFLVFSLVSLTSLAKVSRKAASDSIMPGALHNCLTVLEGEKKIPACTDLVPCTSGHKLEKGSRWMDEFQYEQVTGVWVSDKQICVDKFTDEVKKSACCGG